MTSEILAKIVSGLLNLYPAITAYLSPDSVSAQVYLGGGLTINILFFAMVLFSIFVLLEMVAKTKLCRTPLGLWLVGHVGPIHLGMAFLAVVVPFSASRDTEISAGAMFIYGLILFMNLAMVYIHAKANENTQEASHV